MLRMTTRSSRNIQFLTFTIFKKANNWENSRADQWIPEMQSRVSPARDFSQTLPGFSTGYGGTDVFYFFYKIIICIVNKEKDSIQSAYCKLSQLGDS